MHCAFQRSNSDIQKNSDTRRDSLSRREQKGFRTTFSLSRREQKRFITSLEGCEAPYITWRNSAHRCTILKFLSLEPDGHWRIVALLPQFPENIDQLVSGALVNMDTMHLVYPPAISSFKVNRKRVQKGPPLDVTYSVKPFTSRRLTASTVRHQSRNKALVNKATKWNELSKNPFQKSLTNSDSLTTVSNGNAINSSDMSIGDKNLNSIPKRNSRKKSRKKGKQTKKFSSYSGSNEPEVLPEEHANVSSASDACGNNDGDGPVSSPAAPEIPVPDIRASHSEAAKACISSSGEVCISSADNFEKQLLLEDSGLPIFDGVEDIHTEVSFYNNMYTKGFCDAHGSFILDSISVGSNSDDSTNAGHAEKDSEKEICEVDIFEPPGLSSSRGCFSCQSSLNEVADNFDRTEETRHGILGLNEMQLIVPNKRSKQNKVAPRSANISKFGTTGNLHVRNGKENNHSVWQKVQRNDFTDSTGELKKASSIYSSYDLPLREAPLLKRTSDTTDANDFLKSEDKKPQKDKVSKKMKRKTGPALKQEYNCYSRKGSHASMAGLEGCVKDKMDQNGKSDISAQAKDKKGLSLASRSCSPPNHPRAGFQNSKVECKTSESARSLQLCPNEMDCLESVCIAVSGMKNKSAGNEISSVQRKCRSLNESNLLQVQSPVYLSHLLCNAESQEVHKEISLAESSRLNPSGSGSLRHKWMPIASKNPGLTSSTRSDSSPLEHSDEGASKKWALKDTTKGNLVSNTQNLVSKVSVEGMGQSSGKETCPSDGMEGVLPKSRTIEELTNSKLDAADCIKDSEALRDLNASEADSDRILEAVNNSCRAQVASEAVQMSTGHPIAEFERLLYHSSPVIHQSSNSISCHTCSSMNQVDQVGGVPMCRHNTPHIALGCLWEWYEKYGSYGLEIKAEESGNFKRMGADRFAFRAYFVPYLSGIQLFRMDRTMDSVYINNRICSSEVLRVCGNSKKPQKSSSIGSLPISSALLSQPDRKEDVIPPLVNQLCIPEQSSVSGKDESVLVGDSGSSETELLFEYFESEQPQERRPLYEKIKELVRGDAPSHFKAYGDPTKLESIDLNDLHPRSWYSVAWYPIYRIPDGNFRAAFLTYHSLGHLIRRSAEFKSSNSDYCIASPVVGLQSYNAQDECWFQPSPSTLRQTTVTPGVNHYGVLADRLRTLQETACLMARAVVNKGSIKSANRHPDYEFFVSRRRW